MKINKLPTLVIPNAYNTTSTKINKFVFFVKSIVITLVVGGLLAGLFYINMHHEQKLLLEQKIELEKRTPKDTGIVLDATAAIIKREGNLPIAVARKYAIWVYEAGAKWNVDPLLILSVIAVESRFDYKAVSPTGPIGLLQVAYHWHKEKTTKAALFDPKNNINVGAQILKEYADKSSTDVETLLRFNGSLGNAPVYAMKVLGKKTKFENEIMEAFVKHI